MEAYGVKKVWSAVWPMLLYHIVSIGVYHAIGLFTGEQGPDSAVAATIAACVMLPLLLRERLTDRLTDRLSDRLTDRLSDRLTDRLSDRLTDRLSDRLTDGLSERLTDGLSDKQRRPAEQAHINHSGISTRLILICVLSFVTGALLSVLSAWVMTRFGLYERFGNETQLELLAAPLAVQIIGLGFLVPLAEEMTFRGLLYPRLKEIMGMNYAVIISSLLFAVGHGNMIQFLYALPMGCILCLFYEWGGGYMAVPVLMHMGANLISIFL